MATRKTRWTALPCAAPRALTAAVLLAAALALAGTGCSAPADTVAAHEPAEDGGPLAAAFGARVVNVEVAPVQPTTFVQYIRVVGEVEPLHDVTVSAEESGTIASFLVAKGDRLTRGQPVTRISSDLLDAQVEEARAVHEIAAERYERQRRLWDEQRVGTEMAVLEAKSQVQTSAARLKVLETRQARTLVASPITGTYDEQYVEVGELVAPARACCGYWPPIRCGWWPAYRSATRWRSSPEPRRWSRSTCSKGASSRERSSSSASAWMRAAAPFRSRSCSTTAKGLIRPRLGGQRAGGAHPRGPGDRGAAGSRAAHRRGLPGVRGETGRRRFHRRGARRATRRLVRQRGGGGRRAGGGRAADHGRPPAVDDGSVVSLVGG